MSKPSSLAPRQGPDRFHSTAQQQHVRIWAECEGGDVRHLRVEGDDLVGMLILDDRVTPFRTRVDSAFGWRSRVRTRNAVHNTFQRMRDYE